MIRNQTIGSTAALQAGMRRLQSVGKSVVKAEGPGGTRTEVQELICKTWRGHYKCC